MMDINVVAEVGRQEARGRWVALDVLDRTSYQQQALQRRLSVHNPWKK
jgi:hypothetical protein